MAVTLVIGYGNPLRGDDGLGWHVAQQLTALPRPHDLHILACHQLTPELAEPVSQAALVIFIDATPEGVPGLLTCRWIGADPGAPTTFSHYLTPASLLACAQALYGTCPTAAVLSVAGICFGCSERLSPAMRTALPEVVARVRALAMAEHTAQKPL